MRKPIKIAEINNRNTIKKKAAKVCARNTHTIADILSAERGMFFFKQMPLSEAIAEALAEELITYAQDETEAFTLVRFCKKKGIAKSSFEYWCKKYPCLQKAKETALEWIADNREIGAMTRILDGNSVFKKQAVYDAEYKAETARKATLGSANRATQGVIVVEMPKAEETDVVPLKNRDKKKI